MGKNQNSNLTSWKTLHPSSAVAHRLPSPIRELFVSLVLRSSSHDRVLICTRYYLQVHANKSNKVWIYVKIKDRDVLVYLSLTTNCWDVYQSLISLGGTVFACVIVWYSERPWGWSQSDCILRNGEKRVLIYFIFMQRNADLSLTYAELTLIVPDDPKDRVHESCWCDGRKKQIKAVSCQS